MTPQARNTAEEPHPGGPTQGLGPWSLAVIITGIIIIIGIIISIVIIIVIIIAIAIVIAVISIVIITSILTILIGVF